MQLLLLLQPLLLQPATALLGQDAYACSTHKTMS